MVQLCAYPGTVVNFGDDSIGTVQQKNTVDPLAALANQSFEILTINPGTLQFGSCKQYLSSQHALWMGGHFSWLRMAMCGGC